MGDRLRVGCDTIMLGRGEFDVLRLQAREDSFDFAEALPRGSVFNDNLQMLAQYIVLHCDTD